MSNLKVVRNAIELPFKFFVFPSGEVGVKLGVREHFVSYTAKTGFFTKASHQTIVARLQNSVDIMELLMLVDALKRIDDTPIRLFLLKIPYAQQDRVCDAGESFSIKVFGNLINSLGFQRVTVFDPHSNVSEAVFDNLKVVSQLEIISKWCELNNRLLGCTLLSPDAGSNKKMFEIGKYFQRDFVRADKLRDLSTGQIKETIVYKDDFGGSDVAIIDDICLGGATFIELAKILKTRNCGKIILFVTHGVFSKGLRTLFDKSSSRDEGSLIDEIWTTNSWEPSSEVNAALVEAKRMFSLNLEEKFKDLI